MAPPHGMTATQNRDSDRRFRAYFELPLVGIGISGTNKQWLEVNDTICNILGFSREELLRSTWEDITHPDDIEKNSALFEQVFSGERDGYSLEKRFIHRSGRTIHALLSAQCLRDADGAVESFVVVINDITLLKRSERLNAHRNSALEAIAAGEPLDRVLEIVADGVECEIPNAVCNVLVLDEDGKHLRHVARRNLPDEYHALIDGLEIGPTAGCYSITAYSGETVIVEDTHTDPRSADFVHLLDQIPARTCWSFPVRDSTGNVEGTFVTYRKDPGGPSDGEIDLIKSAANLAGIAIERYHVEQSRLRSEQRYRQLFELAPCGILIENSDGQILDVNPELCHAFDEARDAIVGRHVSSLTTLPKEKVASLLRDTIETGKKSLDVINRRSDGTELHFDIREVPIPLPDGSPGVLVISMDITKRKEVEQALQKSESRFRTLAEHVRMVPFEADIATCNFTYVGPQAELVFGFPRDAWCESGFWYEKLHPDDRQQAIDKCHKCSKTLNDYELEYRMVDIDGSVVWIRDIVHVIRENGRPVKLTGFLLDVTEQREVEQRTRELETEMAHAARLSTAGELMTGIAHELNQPLYAVLNYASACRNTLRTSGSASDDVLDLLGRIVEQAHRAGKTLNEMLRFVRRDPPNPSPTDIARLIADAVSIMEFESRRRHVVLRVKSEPGLPLVLANHVQLQQVLVNLLQNGLDACGEAQDGSGQVDVVAFREGTNVIICVEDNGPGIPTSDILHVLNAFYSTKPEGVGIGLAISKTILEAHDGRIEVANRDAGGAIFRIVLPAWNVMPS